MSEALTEVSAEPPRISELRASIAACLPCEAKHEVVARQELSSLTFNQLLALYPNWAHRFVPREPGKVEYAPDFWDAPFARSHGGNILDIAGRIERGEDLSPFLSRLVNVRGYIPQHVRKALTPEKRRWQDKDFALSALGVHHLHISNLPVGPERARRGNEIAFIEFTKETARFVLAGNHNDFYGERLSRAVAQMRAETVFTFKGVQTRGVSRSHEELSTLAAAGLSTFTNVGDQVVPLSLLATDGTPIFLTKQLMLLGRTIATIEPQIDNSDWASGLFGRASIPMPSSLQFEWVLHCTALHLGERVSGTLFGVVPSYR